MQHLPEELIVLVLRAIDEVVDIARCAAVSKVWRQGGEQSCPSLLLIPARSVEADMPTYNAGAAKAFPTKLVLIADDDRFDDSVQELRWLQQHWVYSANCRSAYVGFTETGHVMAAAFLTFLGSAPQKGLSHVMLGNLVSKGVSECTPLQCVSYRLHQAAQGMNVATEICVS